MDCKIKAAGKNSGIFHEGGTKSSKSFLTVFIRSVFPLSPSFPAGGGIWGPMEKKLLGEISSSSQKETQARKNVEYYINIVFPFCTDFFWKKADKPKEKTGNGSGLGIIFPIGQKKNPGTSWLGYFSSLFPLCCCKWLYEGQAFLGGNYCSVLGFVGSPAFICVLFIHSHLIIISWSVQKNFEVLKIYFA